MVNAPSVINSYVESLITSVKNQGISEASLFKDLDINRDSLNQTGSRLDIETMTKLWLRAAELTQDESIGLRLGQEIRLGAYNILGSLILNSDNVGVALEQLITYQALISEGGEFSLLNEGSNCFICYQAFTSPRNKVRLSHYQVEGVLSGLVKFVFDFLPFEQNPILAPTKVEFTHQAPKNIAIYENFFRCPVVFSAKHTGLWFNKAILNFPIPHADKELFLHHKNLASKKLATIIKVETWQYKVAQVITETDSWFDLSPEFIANKLHLNLRKMQRLLHNENTSYQKVLDELRKDRALSLLKLGDSAQTVADKLAYLDLTSFHRACKRWFNQTPKAISRSI